MRRTKNTARAVNKQFVGIRRQNDYMIAMDGFLGDLGSPESLARIGAGLGSVNPSKVQPRPMYFPNWNDYDWGKGMDKVIPNKPSPKMLPRPRVRPKRIKLAGKGKYAAGAIAAGLALNVIRTRSGPGADKPRGARQTGMYQY